MSGKQFGQSRYEELLQGEGILRTVFKAVKAASAGRGLDRVFITGVSPLVLSDMTSGYNVAENISMLPKLADLCGFTENEIVRALHEEVQELSGNIPEIQKILATMRNFYNGYRFSPYSDTLVYNPTLSLYFCKRLQQYGCYPQELLDSNLAMDRNKLSYIATLPGGDNLIQQALEPSRTLSIASFAQNFGIAELLDEHQDESFMASLLFFFGILTLHGRDAAGFLRLCIPNLVIQQLYVEQLRRSWLPNLNWMHEAHPAVQLWCRQGNPKPVCSLVEQHLFKILANRDYAQANELTIKTAFLLLLANTQCYQVISEFPVGKGYADLALIVRPDQRRFHWLDLIIEFKFLNLENLSLSTSQISALSTQQALAIPSVQNAFDQAQKQLQRYAHELQQLHDLPSVRCYAIVSLGLVRILWQKIDFI